MAKAPAWTRIPRNRKPVGLASNGYKDDNELLVSFPRFGAKLDKLLNVESAVLDEEEATITINDYGQEVVIGTGELRDFYLNREDYIDLPSVDNVSFSEGGDIELEPNENYIYTATVEGGNNYRYLEVDIIVENPAEELGPKEQFTLLASEEDPYNGDIDKFQERGVVVEFANDTWTINFGNIITEAMVNSGTVRVYGAVLDYYKENLWGDMNNTFPEMIVTVNLSRNVDDGGGEGGGED